MTAIRVASFYMVHKPVLLDTEITTTMEIVEATSIVAAEEMTTMTSRKTPAVIKVATVVQEK